MTPGSVLRAPLAVRARRRTRKSWRRAQIEPLSHYRALLPDPGGTADRSQSPLGRHGRCHRDRHRCPGLQLGIAQYHLAARADPEAQRLLDRAVWQMPRSAGVGDEPGRAVRRVAHRWRRVRVFLRLYRWRSEPVVSDTLRGNHAGRAEEDTT